MNFHLKALLVGAVTIFLCAAVFIWMVILDKGTLLITAQVPYSVEVNGDRLKVPEKKMCTSNPCSISLPTGDYVVDLFKDGYYDESRLTSLARGATSTLDVEFVFIPTVELSGNYETYAPILEEVDLSGDFSFEMDAEHNKQRLVYTDPETHEVTVWAYFDRALVNPLVFAHSDLNAALVVDRAEAEQVLYVIDGVEFKRSYLGALGDVSDVEWSLNGSKLLIQTETTRTSEIGMWVVDVATGDFSEWPFEMDLEKVSWDGTGRLVFVTDRNLAAIEGDQFSSTMDVLSALLSGEYSGDVAFWVGQYDPQTGTYEVIHEAGKGLDMDFEDVFVAYDKVNDLLYFTDGVLVYEVARTDSI